MSSLCLVCLVGLPGAGKTQVAYSLYKFPNARVVVLEYDRLISNLEGTWKSKRKRILETVKNELFEGRVLIVLDDNFFYRSMRHECFMVAREIGASFCQIYINTPVAQCLVNNFQRCFPVTTDVVLRMNDVFEAPDPNNYTWEKQTLITQFDPSLLQIEDFIQSSWDVKISPAPQITHQPQPQNQIHFADLALRKHISKMLNDPKNHSLGKDLALKKSEVLKKIKSGDISLPPINENVVDTYYNYLENIFLC